MPPAVVAQLVILIILLFLSAFFSSAETSLTSVNKHRIRSLADDEANKKASLVMKLIEEPQRMLSAILIGNNIVNLSASSLATSLAINYFENIGAGIVTGILTFFILVFGEIMPKNLATLYSEKLSLAYAPIIYAIMVILTPVSFVLNKISAFLMFILRIDTKSKATVITENELRTIVDVSHEEGVIESDERTMITNVVDFGDSYAKDVMVPRIDMTFADVNMNYEALRDIFKAEQYSRLPVYSEDRDNIVGIINLKDVFFYNGDNNSFDIRNFMRDAYFTYEHKKTSELLNEMRKASISIAIVLDEYGAVAGLITLEDLLEEIVGEIRDEYDYDEEDDIQKISDNEYIIDGASKLEDINELLGLNLNSEDYDSIAGHVINLLEHLPHVGEQVKEGNVTFTVSAMDKKRIDKIHIQLDKLP